MRVSECIQIIFKEIKRQIWHFEKKDILSKIDWTLAEQLLILEEELFFDSTYDDYWDNASPEEWETYVKCSDLNDVNSCIVYAKSENFELFEKTMELFYTFLEKDIETFCSKENHHWYGFTDYFFKKSNFYEIILALKNIDRSHYILPYVLRYEKLIKKIAVQKGDYDERNFFHIYDVILDLADNSSYNSGIPKEKQLKYTIICFEYEDKINALSKKDFEFNYRTLFKEEFR